MEGTAFLTTANRDPLAVVDGLAVFMAAAAVYLVCILLRAEVYKPPFMSTDNEANQYVPVSMIATGDMHLDEYIAPDQEFVDNSLIRANGHWVPFHPVGAALLALPFYLLAAPFADNLNAWAWALFRVAAASYTAGGVAILHSFAYREISGRIPRLLVTALLAFGTPLMAIASQDFYQQTAIFFLQSLILLRLKKENCRPGVVTLMIAFFSPLCRPTTWLTAAVVAGLACRAGARSIRNLVLCAVLMAVPHVLISAHVTGAVLPMFSPYWRKVVQGSYWGGDVLFNLAGFWILPTFGVLFFAPVGIAMLVAAIRASARWRELDLFERSTLGLFLGYLTYVSLYRYWYGGYSYGPRFLIDLLPFGFVFLAREVGALYSRRALVAIVLALSYSFVVQSTGAVHANGEWNEIHDRGLAEYGWFSMLRDGPIHFYLKRW